MRFSDSLAVPILWGTRFRTSVNSGLTQLIFREARVCINPVLPKETKYIYSYIYTKGFDRIITDINIGEIQQTIKIKNKGLKKSLEILEELKYLVYQEYATGMYTITLN